MSEQANLDAATKRDEIASELRRLVADGQLKRGTWIRQNEIAIRFGVSITPVREALRQLEAEGLLIGEPHKGVRVASIDTERLKGIYIARRLVEPYAMQRAALRVSRRDIGEMKRANERMREASAAGDELAVRDANRWFHFILYSRTGVGGLVDVIESLWASFPWDVLLGARVSASYDEHAEIVSAVEQGDLDAVRIEADNHIARSYVALLQHLEHSELPPPDPFDLEVD